MMRSSQEIRGLLRAQHAEILREWQAEVRAQGGHPLLVQSAGDTGPYRCAEETLRALEDFYSMTSADAPTDDIVGVIDAAAMRLQSRALEWSALPLPWGDVRMLLRLLASCGCRILEKQGVGNEERNRYRMLMESLTLATSDLRIQHVEQELTRDREEAMMTQHLAGRFLSNASHELRTPLTAVLGFTELLQEETYGPLNPEQTRAVNHIHDSAQNLLEIVNNLLDLLHIRAGKLNLSYRRVEVAPVLQSLYDLLTGLAERKSVLFTLELPNNLGAIDMDENIVRHIVYHLLSSALRSTPTGGKVVLSAKRAPNRLTILTHDTALHLPPEAITNMMGPFPLLENSPVRGYEGWEVGLPLVRRYVDLHGGKLEMESRPEQGTTFRILLPATRPTASSG